MGQEIIVPDNFGAPAQAFLDAGLNAEADNLAEGIGQSYGVIGYKGKNWSLRYRGQKYDFMRPDTMPGMAPERASWIDVIILEAASNKSKSFYPKWDANQSEGERPMCSSLDGVTPDADSTQRQASACAICPRNEWKTDSNGKKGRECQDYKRLAVMLMPNVTEKMMGQKLMEPVFLRVPPASLNALAILGETMADQRGYHSSAYITRITFDPDKSWPEMVFRPLQGLRAEEAPVIIEVRKDPAVRRIVHGDRASASASLTTQGTAAPAITMAASSPANTSVLPAIAPAPPPSPALATGFVGLGGADIVVPASPPPSNGNGFAPASQATPQVATQTQADLGATEESDADLDAKIAEILAKKPS